jgi:hypothetical protein
MMALAGGPPARAQPVGAQGPVSDEVTQPSQTGQQGEPSRSERDQITRQLQVAPRGWVRIGYDFDNDGQYDAVEEVYALDLQQARSRSERRRGGDVPALGGRQVPGPGQRREARGRFAHIEGRLQEIFTVNLAGLSEPHVVGNVRTDDGRLERVDFGPRDQVRELNLRRNDRVSVAATRGLLNDRPVFVARQVEAKGLTIAVDQPRGSDNLRRVNGRILSTRVASFLGHTHEHLLAQVRLDNGRIETVDLGSVNNLSRGVTLRQGDRISLLAVRARINDEPALLATQIHTPQGQVVQVDISEGREELRLQGTPVSPEWRQEGNRGRAEPEPEATESPRGDIPPPPNLDELPSTEPSR